MFDNFFNKLRGFIILEHSLYKGYEFLITNGMVPCCYIILDNSHPFYGKDCDSMNNTPFYVHGGITFTGINVVAPLWTKNPWVIGWDYGHVGDYFDGVRAGKIWSVEELEEECKSAIDRLETIRLLETEIYI